MNEPIAFHAPTSNWGTIVDVCIIQPDPPREIYETFHPTGWPLRIIFALGGRAPQVGDWYAECCLLDLEQIADADRLRSLFELQSDGDTGGTFGRTREELVERLDGRSCADR
jgi:hypothetical protein